MDKEQIGRLPCAYYIIAGLKDKDIKGQSAFALSYIRYLELSGITKPEDIGAKLTSLAMYAQFTNVSRKTPIDFLKIGNKTYTLADEASLNEYRSALLSSCKEPLSFSNMFERMDQSKGVCHTCPYSPLYSQVMLQEELSLAKAMLKDPAAFSVTVSHSKAGLEDIFSAWIELYDIIPKVRRPLAFPALLCLMRSIQLNLTNYFGGFFSKDYQNIQSGFKKRLPNMVSGNPPAEIWKIMTK